MLAEPDGFPPFHAYALAHRCSTCGAAPGQPCDVPRKQAEIDKRNSTRAQLGHPPLETDPLHLLHASRTDAGGRHRDRDVAAAPWPEDREPGRRYDTLGEHWQAPPESA